MRSTLAHLHMIANRSTARIKPRPSAARVDLQRAIDRPRRAIFNHQFYFLINSVVRRPTTYSKPSFTVVMMNNICLLCLSITLPHVRSI